MEKNWYNRLLLSYIPIFIIVSLVLIIIFLLGAAEMTRKETVRANEVFSGQATQSLEYSLRAINEMMNREIISNGFTPFFTKSGNPYIAANEVSRKLNEIKLSNPLIDSLYLYRHQDGVVLGHQSMQTADQFADRAFLTQMLEQPGRTGWSDPRTLGTEGKVVVSLTRTVPLLTGEHGLMVVNVSQRALRDFLRGMIGNEFSFIHLYDSSGTLWFGTESEDLEAVSASVGREISDVESGYTGWSIRSGMLGGSPFRAFAELSDVWIVAIMATLAVGLAWLILVSRRHYRPVVSLVKRIRDLSSPETAPEETPPAKDEFTLIESALSKIVQQSAEYRKQQEADIVYKRRHFFHELMEGGRTIDMEEWRKELRRFGMDPAFDEAAVGLLEIDKYAAFERSYSGNGKELLRYALTNVIVEIAAMRSVQAWPEWISSQQLGLLFRSKRDGSEQDFEDWLRELCEHMVRWTADNLKFSVTLSIGSRTTSLSELHLSYDDALEAMKYKSVLGNGRVIGQQDIRSRSEGEVYKGLQMVRGIAQSYRMGEELWAEQLKQMFDDFRSRIISKDDLINVMNYLIYHLFREMMELPGEIQDIWKDEVVPALNEALERFETVDELYEDVRRLLEENAQKLKLLREGKSNHHVIQEVRKFIEEQASNPNLSLSLIGERFQMSNSYVSRLFKDEFGENFVDYVAKVRIEHAKRLLRDTGESIHHIATTIGYTNYMTFNRVFKKVTATTPSEYRSRHQAT
ncbi:helix-turn-helix domain-containing protein [Paenibacillus antri]|uniref:Helix-turn-helix domain-containing protein n=1 Tax=Paenibacillus antri TaxID=2582848 RepID=A0A5R9G8P8_9BACL|nr:helix-turn-helix domain-containing protein [Paenibacillus antri]TLS52782.1 helix-turn-helix domain-containing protein [Paenibacillus antri]